LGPGGLREGFSWVDLLDTHLVACGLQLLEASVDERAPDTVTLVGGQHTHRPKALHHAPGGQRDGREGDVAHDAARMLGHQ
jgi:hypothetical protein